MEQEEQNQDKLQEEGAAPVEQAPAEVVPEAPVATTEPESSTSKNVVIVAVLAIIVLVLAFMYVWGSRSVSQTDELPVPEVPVVPDFVLEDIAPVQPLSDEVEVLEADLDTTEIDSLDEELEDMEAELDTLLEEL